MHFHKFAEKVFGSRAKMRLLEVLFTRSTTEFTGRELAREVGFSPARVHRILQDFTAENLVTMRRSGRSYLFRLNEKAFLAGKLKYIFGKAFLPLEEVKRITSTNLVSPEIVSIVLFGSIARGEEKPASDIDLCIIAKDGADKDSVRGKALELNRLTTELFGNMVSPIVLTVSEFRDGFKKDQPVVREVLRNGILLCGKSPVEIITE